MGIARVLRIDTLDGAAAMYLTVETHKYWRLVTILVVPASDDWYY